MKKKTLDFLESQINEIYTRLKTFLVRDYTPTITKTSSLSTLMEGIDLLADRVLSSELEASLRSLQHVPGAWEAFKTKLGYEGIVCEYDTEKPSFKISIPGIQHWAKELYTVIAEPTSAEAPKDQEKKGKKGKEEKERLFIGDLSLLPEALKNQKVK